MMGRILNSKEHWGTIYWRFLHTFVENIEEDTFSQYKCQIIDLINYIGTHLPCGICSMHYLNLHKIKYTDLFHKEGLKILLWDIQNKISISNSRKPYPRNILLQYKSLDYNTILSEFHDRIQKMYGVINIVSSNINSHLKLVRIKC